MTRKQFINKKIVQIVKDMPVDERVAVAYGFYDLDGMYGDAYADDFIGFANFDDGDNSVDSTTSVNGEFGTNGMFEGLDNFQDGDFFEETDDDFDNLFSKKSRRKLKKKVKGISIKKIGKGIKNGLKKVSIKNVGKGIKKLGKAVGKGIKAVGKVIKKGVLFVPRQAGRGLVALNYRGSATKMNASLRPENKKYQDRLAKKWRSLGGSFSKGLLPAIKSGAKKKPLLCGAKCKSNLAKAVGKTKSNFLNADGSMNLQNFEVDKNKLRSLLREELSQYNVEPATATLIATGAGVLTTILSTVAGAKLQKKEQEFLEAENEKNRKQAEKELELVAKEQGIKKEQAKRELDIIEKKVQAELDPVNQILNNPDLTQEEKNEAVKQVNQALEVKDQRKKSNLLLYAGIGLVALLGIGFLRKK
tara:strand:- start:12498 stop:13748 length:1251 start_codon:yes stop_codon:yes gene_type:complete